MSRYFFDLADGSVARDVDGLELSSINEARRAAVQYAGEVLRDKPDFVWDHAGLAVQVRSETDLELFRIVIYALNAPALKS